MAQAHLRLTEIPVKLIYNDPNRHFGGKLDDAGNRLRHYLDVLHAELHRNENDGDEQAEASQPEPAVVSCSCTL